MTRWPRGSGNLPGKYDAEADAAREGGLAKKADID
jgi:hypothetical protein